MNTPLIRYIVLVFGFIIGLHYILSITHEEYNRITSLSNLASQFRSSSSSKTSDSDIHDAYYNPMGFDVSSVNASSYARVNATLLFLARNSDVNGVVQSMREVEDRFNRKYNYPWTFLNEEPFTDEFKKRVSVLTNAPIEFGIIPHDHWFQPDWIDESKAKAGREKMQNEGVIYGGSLSYRNMCRFNSGFFFRHPLLQKYRYYWRVEPDVHFHCDVNFDPFLLMKQQNKVYGFTIAMYEFEKTIETLWSTVIDFVRQYPQFVSKNSAASFITDNDGDTYNLCHFWSNFEIADLDFWRGEVYMKFFEHLDNSGGFYYERWGDAPVHSIAAALFLDKSQIHFFDEIGYEHNPYTHCPADDEKWRKGRCGCDQKRSFDYDGYSCMRQWDRAKA